MNKNSMRKINEIKKKIIVLRDALETIATEEQIKITSSRTTEENAPSSHEEKKEFKKHKKVSASHRIIKNTYPPNEEKRLDNVFSALHALEIALLFIDASIDQPQEIIFHNR